MNYWWMEQRKDVTIAQLSAYLSFDQKDIKPYGFIAYHHLLPLSAVTVSTCKIPSS